MNTRIEFGATESTDFSAPSDSREALRSIVGPNGEPLKSSGHYVAAKINPFDADHVEAVVAYGSTVWEILEAVGLPPDAPFPIYVFFDDWIVSRETWKRVRPKPGTIISVACAPAGGGGGKDTLRTVAMIAVMVAAFMLGGPLGAAIGLPEAFAIGGTTINIAAAVGSALITFAGTMAINALIPPSSQKLDPLGRSAGSDPLVPLITGTSNQANRYGAVTKIYGRHKIYPTYGAAPFTEIQGDDQYLRQLFVVGYGRLNISDIRIGGTPIDNFEDVEYEVREGTASDAAITLYTRDVDEQSMNVLLDPDTSWTTRTAGQEASELSVDIAFPQGLQFFNRAGRKREKTVDVTVQYRKSGSTGGWSSAGTISTTDKTSSLIRKGLRWTVARGLYEVRVRRDTAEDTTPKRTVFDTVYWTAIRAINGGNRVPVLQKNLAMIAVRIRASNQLQGVIQTLSCVAQSYLQAFNGSTWGETLTRNAAWAFADVLIGDANERALATARLDGSDLLDWANDNSSRGRNFDAVIDQQTTVYDLLSRIAAAGRASPTSRDGLFSVVRDVAQTTPVQVFSPRNSHTFTAQKAFPDIPHAIRVRFIDPDAEYQENEVIVYDDGYTASNATRYETLFFWGITDASTAWKEGRYHIAAARLRPELYQITTDVEHIVANRGDLVRVSHDVPLWGQKWGRVATVTLDGGLNATAVSLDEESTMEAGKSYVLRFRLDDGAGGLSVVVEAVDTVPGTGVDFTFTTPIAPPSTDQPQVGDLVLMGELTADSVDLIIKAIEPEDDFAARLTFVDAAPAVHTAESAAIPPFNPQISLPPQLQRPVPPVPIVVDVRSDESVLTRGPSQSLRSRILVSINLPSVADAQADFIEARYRRTNGDSQWQRLSYVPAASTEVSVEPVEDGEAYDIRLRSLTALGHTSEWTEIDAHVVIGMTSPPPDIETLLLENTVTRWVYDDPPVDIRGFEVRYRAGTRIHWDSGTKAHEGVITETRFDVAGIPAGTQTIMVKALDVAENYSVNAAFAIKDIVGSLVDNVVVSEDYKAAGFPGVITDGTIDGGGNLDADGDGTLFWKADESQKFWETDSSVLFWIGNYKRMEYEFEFVPAADAVPAKMTIDSTIVGDPYEIEYKLDGAGLFWDQDSSVNFWQDDAALFWTGIGDEWLSWPGELDVDAREKFHFRVTTWAGKTQGTITKLTMKMDVPDLVEYFSDIVIGASGTRLTLTNDFRAIDNVQVTLQDDGGSATKVRVLDKELTGPLIGTFTTADAGTTGLIDATVQGH